MEEKNNIAKILKDKPEGTKLWTDMFGSVTLYVVTDTCDAFQVKHHNKEPWFDKDGKLYKEGVLCIYPSKSMRSWHKFAWKKGDVLVNKDGDVYIIFERFADDTYCSFVGKYYLWKENNDTEYFYKNERLLTSDFQKAGKDAAQTYISTIEERLGGKLNRETLEIEKIQPEFKDGDIVRCINGTIVLIKEISFSQKVYFHAYIFLNKLFFQDNSSSYYGHTKDIERIATDDEKQQLFDALAKEGKTWDAEKKQIIDLKPKIELKPFDKVLVKDNPYGSWELAFFWKRVDVQDLHPYMIIGGKRYRFCEPYEGNEHLLDN